MSRTLAVARRRLLLGLWLSARMTHYCAYATSVKRFVPILHANASWDHRLTVTDGSPPGRRTYLRRGSEGAGVRSSSTEDVRLGAGPMERNWTGSQRAERSHANRADELRKLRDCPERVQR